MLKNQHNSRKKTVKNCQKFRKTFENGKKPSKLSKKTKMSKKSQKTVKNLEKP